MDVAKKFDDVPRPRLFEDAGSHSPGREVVEFASSPPRKLERWVFQVQDTRCSVAYPVGWKRLAPSSPDVLGSFAPGVHGPELCLRMHRVLWEVDPVAYLMQVCHARGLTVTLARADPDSLRLELGGLRDIDGTRWRMSAVRHQGRFVSVETAAPHDEWEGLCSLFLQCRQSFEVLPLPTVNVVEPQRTHRTKHLQFFVPRSWSAERRAGNSDREQILFSAAASACRGLLLVGSGESGTSTTSRDSAILGCFESRGFRVTGRLALRTSGIRTFSGIVEGVLERDGEAYCLRIAHRRLRGVDVDYATVVPREGVLTLDAMRTFRAAEITIDSTNAHVDLVTQTASVRPRHRGAAR